MEFLEMTKPGDPRWERLRADAQRCLQEMSKAPAPAPAPVVRSAPPAAPKPEARAEAAPKAELPGVSIEFLPMERPDFAKRAAVADHFLRRRFLELKLAQNFEDLICLGSLNGVDSYAYQHDTVRRVLRHFKGRALLADEVGLGKTIEACLILKEYRMRGMARRALVLTPPSLAPQNSDSPPPRPTTPNSAAIRAASGVKRKWWWPASPWPGWSHTPARWPLRRGTW